MSGADSQQVLREAAGHANHPRLCEVLATPAVAQLVGAWLHCVAEGDPKLTGTPGNPSWAREWAAAVMVAEEINTQVAAVSARMTLGEAVALLRGAGVPCACVGTHWCLRDQGEYEQAYRLQGMARRLVTSVVLSGV